MLLWSWLQFMFDPQVLFCEGEPTKIGTADCASVAVISQQAFACTLGGMPFFFFVSEMEPSIIELAVCYV